MNRMVPCPWSTRAGSDGIVNVTQKGFAQYSDVSQSGASTAPRLISRLKATCRLSLKTGYSGIITVTQIGDSPVGSSSDVMQTAGSRGSTLTVDQAGSGNSVGSLAAFSQSADMSTSTLGQDGDNNAIEGSQAGYLNILAVAQIDNWNSATVVQSGSENDLAINQAGDFEYC